MNPKLILFLLTINIVNGNLANYFCSPTYESVDNLIKDLIASNVNHSIIEDVDDFCQRRNPSTTYSDFSLIPKRITISRNSSFWLISFTHKNYPMVYQSDESESFSNQDESQLTWLLYVLSRRPFDCSSCRISIHLSFNLTNHNTLPIAITMTYGFLKTMFPTFIDYTRPAVIWREDKSKFITIDHNLTIENDEVINLSTINQSTIEANIYLDNSFFGDIDQHFLIGYKKLTDLIVNSTHFNDSAPIYQQLILQSEILKPLISYTLCYSNDPSSDVNYYRVQSTCYPYIDNFVRHCICWETTRWKTYFLFCAVSLLAIFPFIYIIYLCKRKSIVKTIDRYELPDAPVACGSESSIKIRCGSLPKQRLPGSLTLDLKRPNGSSIGTFTISSSIQWSTCCLITNDVCDLIVKFRSVKPIDKPRYIEVNFDRENIYSASKLIYLYGIEIETATYRQIYPYSHYLQHNRTVRLSDATDWTRALTRINFTTSLPISLQKVQSLTLLEKSLINLYVLQFLAEKLIISMELYTNHYIAGIAEGLSTLLFLYTWLLIVYICFFKRHDTDRYNLMKLSQNHQLFTLIAFLLLIMLIIEIFNTFLVVDRSIWRSDLFNSTIALNYTSTIQQYDINWMIATLIAFIIGFFGSLIVEKLIYKLHKPFKPGPITFDLGYDANENR